MSMTGGRRDFVFSGPDLWVRLAGDGAATPVAAPPGADWPEECFVTPSGERGRALDAPEGPPAGHGLAGVGLRDLFDRVAPATYAAAQQAFQLLHWRRTHRYCGACGATLRRKTNGECAMHCGDCRMDFFPRLNPVVITRVTRGDEILLARRQTMPGSFFSVIAGFVEAGETLEQTVAREIREEVGIEVRDIRYFASQPWPFPNNLMIAFTAAHAGGEVRPDGEEIGEAAWFRRAGLPPIPHPISISRRLIDDFVTGGRDCAI